MGRRHISRDLMLLMEKNLFVCSLFVLIVPFSFYQSNPIRSFFESCVEISMKKGTPQFYTSWIVEIVNFPLLPEMVLHNNGGCLPICLLCFSLLFFVTALNVCMYPIFFIRYKFQKYIVMYLEIAQMICIRGSRSILVDTECKHIVFAWQQSYRCW